MNKENRIMKIETKNVKFGDCNLIIGDNENLLVDCGSANQNKETNLNSSEFAYSKIEDDIKCNRIDNLMISHFHTDHFNGILKIPDSYKFKNIYLPYSIVEGKSIYTKDIAVLLAIAPKNSWGFKLSKKIVELFRKLPKITSNIKFLKRKDSVNFDGKELKILWPEIEYVCKEISSIWERQNDFDDIDMPQDLIESINDFKDAFNSYLFHISNLQEENNSEHTVEQRILNEDNNIIFRFERSFGDLIGNRETYKEINYSSYYGKIIKRYYYQRYNSLITTMNAISLVCACEDKFIFLGDVPPNVIEYISHDFEKCYKVVKIQHHATARYYTNYTPTGETYIFSNAGYKNRKIDSRFFDKCNRVICAQKGYHIHSCNKYDLICGCHKKCLNCSVYSCC